MRRDDAERAAVEHPRHLGDAGHPHQRGHADVERGHADLTGGIEREARMLHVDIEAVETRGLGDARDLDAADQPHRHRGNDLAAGKLVLDVIAQDVVDLARHWSARFNHFVKAWGLRPIS